jgi:hypothetical protein
MDGGRFAANGASAYGDCTVRIRHTAMCKITYGFAMFNDSDMAPSPRGSIVPEGYLYGSRRHERKQ